MTKGGTSSANFSRVFDFFIQVINFCVAITDKKIQNQLF